MLKPRFPWKCDVDGCCVFMGGTAVYDVWMASCHVRPLDPAVMLRTEDHRFEFDNRAEMNHSIDNCRNGVQPRDRPALREAQTFVNTFFPTPVRAALDAMDKGAL